MKIRIIETDFSKKYFLKETLSEMTFNDVYVVEKKDKSGDLEYNIINIHPECVYQSIIGIGGALTDASAYVISQMDEKTKRRALDLLFSKKGANFNFLRISINSCDFSKSFYSYVDDGDYSLISFDIGHDKEYLIPLLKRIKTINSDAKVLASPWSAPAFMKTANSLIGGHLKDDCYDVWSRYIARFIESYLHNGVSVWGVTLQNEPRHQQTWESCLFTQEEEQRLLNYLGKEMEGTDVKILCYDHCRERIFEKSKFAFENDTKKYCSGIANHWYSGHFFDEVRAAKKAFPHLLQIATEGCVSDGNSGVKNNLSYAEGYAFDIINAFKNGLDGYLDWNLVLDENNGPFHNRPENRYVAAQIIYDRQKKVLNLEPHYFYMCHISKFIESESQVIGVGTYDSLLSTVAFKNKDGSLVLVALNNSDVDKKVAVRLNKYVYVDQILSHSIKTYIINYL